MYSLCYSVFIFFWTILISLKYTYDRYVHGKFPGLLLQKLGIVKQTVVSKGKKRRIWIHATSFGETLSTKALVQKLSQNDDVSIVFSTFTTVGYNVAKSMKGVDQVIILPIDMKRSMRALAKEINPDLYIHVESDFWLNLLVEVKKLSIPMVLVGGRISDRSHKRFARVRPFAKRLFTHFDHLLLQDSAMEAKFLDLGVSSEKIKVIGNLKLDAPYVEQKEKDYYLDEKKRYVTLGSTHPKEETFLLDLLSEVDKDVSFILAPRRPDRFEEVEELLNKRGVSWRFVGERGNGNERVVYVNRLGILEDCYAKSNLAIVGGSFFDGAGGHNVFEPVRHGTPVLYGGYTYNQNSLTKVVEDFGVGKKCTSDTLLNEVVSTLNKGRIDAETLEEIKESSVGVTEKAIKLINCLLNKR